MRFMLKKIFFQLNAYYYIPFFNFFIRTIPDKTAKTAQNAICNKRLACVPNEFERQNLTVFAMSP